MIELKNIQLLPLEECDREQFIKDNQEAFNYGALVDRRGNKRIR